MGVGEPHGQVVALYVSPASGEPMQAVHEVTAQAGTGLVGDRYHGSRHRHVSVVARDDLNAASTLFGAEIPVELTRRNIVVNGISVPTSPGDRLRIAGVELEVVRIAAPCKLMEELIGDGAKAALRRRAGTIFRLHSSGAIAVGDAVSGQ